MNTILYIFLPMVLLTPLYSYHMAVSRKQEPPFPHATITNTACHYPQDIVFRAGMLPAGSFIALTYYVIYRWIASEKKRVGYPGEIFSWMGHLAQASIIGFYCAIGTIDGAGYPNIHSIGAVFFFIVLFLISFVSTLVLREMHKWDCTVLSRESMVIKSLLALYLILLVVYCVVGVVLESGEENDDDKYLVIIEWNLVYVCLVWLLSFRRDWDNLELTLKAGTSSTLGSDAASN